MTSVYHDSKLSDDERRVRLYAGDMFMYSPSRASLALCELARDLAMAAFSPLDAEVAQYELPVETYAEILADLKPAFIHHPDCKALIPEILASTGCDLEKTYFDVPRLRTSTSDGYLTTGIAYAFHPHRDTWYSAPHCQINWWMPVYDISSNNAMAFYPQYFHKPVKNGSHTYNYYRWNEESRANAAKHIGKDTRVQPRPEEPMDLELDLRLLPSVGGLILFSGAQMHGSITNTSGRTRFSIDFRTVNEHDVRDQRGAHNVDSRCTGTNLRDFQRSSDFARLAPDLVAMYDEEPPPPDAVTLYKPTRRSS